MVRRRGVDGIRYTWKVPGDGEGVVSESALLSERALATRLKSNASDCRPYTGPKNIFSPPTDLAFEPL